jgi:hypothetical protein
LTFGQAPPISLEEFNHDAKNQLSAKQFGVLEKVDIRGGVFKHSSGRIKSIATMLDEVQRDIIEIRKAKAQNLQSNINSLPKTVLSENPLEREKQIMRWQWEELDSIEAGKTFTLTEVLVYKLKLQVLSRLYSFNPDAGAAVMASIVDPAKKMED